MNSENLQRAWELIAEKAARENDPRKHVKLIEELLSLMSELHASREEDRKKEVKNENESSPARPPGRCHLLTGDDMG